jgi:twitching motility two-component system response regulator PilH
MIAVAGYQVSLASSGNEGIRRAFSEVPHCILLNTILPDVSGFEVCRKLRASDPGHRHPIILISSKNTSLDYNWGLRQGADYYLVIPFKQEELLRAVRYVLSPRFRPPTTIQQLIAGDQPEPAARAPHIMPVDWTLLIPARREEPALLASDNPFETPSIIRDKSARRVYDVVDGHKNIRDICYTTGLPVKIVLQALHLLLNSGRIQLYKPDGTSADAVLLPKN